MQWQLFALLENQIFSLLFTCNPKWPEILAELEEGQAPNDRPDLIARVFYMKVTGQPYQFHRSFP